MTNIEVRLRSSYNSLSETERKAADYFFKNPNDVCNLPIAELAQRSGVSPTAWVRLCKAVGCGGVKDMRKELYAEGVSTDTAKTNDIHFADLREGNSAEQIIHAVSSASIQAMRDTAKLLDKNELARAAQCIMGAKSIRLFGVGASGLVADDLYQKLTRINLHAMFTHDTHAQLGYGAVAGPEDVGVFISNTGCTRETLEPLAAMKKRGCKTIGITRYSKSPLAAGCDILLYTASPEVYVRSGAMSSRLAQLMTIDVLFTLIAGENYDTIKDSLEESYAICQTHRVEG